MEIQLSQAEFEKLPRQIQEGEYYDLKSELMLNEGKNYDLESGFILNPKCHCYAANNQPEFNSLLQQCFQIQ